MQSICQSKVNNWAIEISPFRITFECIKGIKNTLADTMSRLIEIDSQVQQVPEPEGYEFGYYVFDNLPNIEVTDIEPANLHYAQMIVLLERYKTKC